MKAYTNDVKDVIKGLETNSHEGLTYEEVNKRVEKYGKNKLKEKKLEKEEMLKTDIIKKFWISFKKKKKKKSFQNDWKD